MKALGAALKSYYDDTKNLPYRPGQAYPAVSYGYSSSSGVSYPRSFQHRLSGANTFQGKATPCARICMHIRASATEIALTAAALRILA